METDGQEQRHGKEITFECPNCRAEIIAYFDGKFWVGPSVCYNCDSDFPDIEYSALDNY
jgi:hypothetical protein